MSLGPSDDRLNEGRAAAGASDRMSAPRDRVRHMRVIGTIRPSTTEQIVAEADTYEEGRRRLAELIPEGYDLLAIRTEKD